MPAVTRIGDPFSCTDKSAAGSGDVFVNGIPITRVGDATTGHPCPPGGSVAPPTKNKSGSGTVFANGLPICRVGDPLVPHKCNGNPPHGGVFVGGSGDVFAG